MKQRWNKMHPSRSCKSQSNNVGTNDVSLKPGKIRGLLAKSEMARAADEAAEDETKAMQQPF